jgi:exosortase/archaeosortase family protein
MEGKMKGVSFGKTITGQKQTFALVLLILVMVLAVMPFAATFNDLLTRLVMSLKWYRIIQEYVIPWEVRMVGVLLYPLGLKPGVAGDYLSINRGAEPFLVEIAWNCIGWQSILFFLMTAWVGLQGDRYTNMSKIKAWIIGFLGTFLVNLLRIALVTVIAYYLGQKIAIIFHDYGSTITVIGWLLVFWWFVYAYVLEERGSSLESPPSLEAS